MLIQLSLKHDPLDQDCEYNYWGL